MKAFLKRKLEQVKEKCSKRAKQFFTVDEEVDKSVTDGLPCEHATSVTSEANKVPQQNSKPAQGLEGDSFTDSAISDLMFVEIFAGTARLSKHAKEAGFRVLPVDKTASRSSQIYIAQYDVTDPGQFESLMQVLQAERHRIAAIHLAPACGTASKAWEKKLLKWVNKGFN